VLAYDALATHASAGERRIVMRTRRWALLFMGLVCGYLGALPALLWAFGALSFVFAPLLLVASVWLYTLVFAFAACWFVHYALAELQRLRDAAPAVVPGEPTAPTAPTASTASTASTALEGPA
jgi:hypothetical protein